MSGWVGGEEGRKYMQRIQPQNNVEVCQHVEDIITLQRSNQINKNIRIRRPIKLE